MKNINLKGLGDGNRGIAKSKTLYSETLDVDNIKFIEINFDSGKTNINLLKNCIPMTIMQHDVVGMIDSGSDIYVANISVLSKYSVLSEYFINNSDVLLLSLVAKRSKLTVALFCRYQLQIVLLRYNFIL